MVGIDLLLCSVIRKIMGSENMKLKLFVNDNNKARDIARLVQTSFEEVGFQFTDQNYDLAIAVGGDGSFLRMVRENNFNSDIYYVGINAGTLGFLQEITLKELTYFIGSIVDRSFQVVEIGIQETEVYTKDKLYTLCSLNEIVVRDALLNTCYFDVKIDQRLLEHYAGDGMLIATSVGSTAYNLSFGGSIVFDDFHTLQLTPIAPLNSKVHNSLRNSIIIPENRKISILPQNIENQFLVTADGENYIYDDVEKIDTVVNKKKIKCLRFSKQFVDKVNDKFLS